MKIFERKKYKIFIHNNALAIMESHRQCKVKQKEAGGILLGQIRKNEIHVLKATHPCNKDHRSRFRFQRNKNNAQKVINHEFYKSRGRTIYLGEWHSHPELYPSPSSIDKNMIRNQYYKNKINENFLLMIIVGLNENSVSLFDGKEIF
jgi:integrative and conjugative element protein (TIGR02256 family)